MNIIKNNKDSSSPDPLCYGDLIRTEHGKIFMLVQSNSSELILLDWTNDYGPDNFNREVDPANLKRIGGWDSLNTETILEIFPSLTKVKKIRFKLLILGE